MPKLQDLSEQRFGNLLVVSLVKTTKNTTWSCKCDCGTIKSVRADHLKSGKITSCGCLAAEIHSKRLKTERIHAKAGPRKCKRCKKIFNRSKGELTQICLECKTRCSRCNVLLTKDNTLDSVTKRNEFLCITCIREKSNNSKDPTKQREYALLNHFGITMNEYDKLLEAQNGNCWICNEPPKNKRLAVDHEHKSGEKRKEGAFDIRKRVRGLLCWQCNSAIAKFRDNPIKLRRAAEYLETWPAQAVLKK